MIAVFTKYDQFRRDVRMKLEDQDRDQDDPTILNAEMERIYHDEFLAHLRGSPPIVRLESEGFYQLAFIMLISAMQECTGMTNGVQILLKQLQRHYPAGPLLSCFYLYRRVTWN